jgi:photosystem II stability/assembly factor-like uncharacterized protein
MNSKLGAVVATVGLWFAPQAHAATAWISESSPTISNLYGVASSDSTTWVAVGNGGVIVRSTDGGVVWNPISSPVGDALRGVSFHGTTGIAVGLAGRVLRTTDGGLNWTQETRPTTRALYAVSMGPSVAVITGEEGGIFVSTDDGAHWSPHTAGTASVLFGVSVSGNTGVGVGGQGAIVMSNNAGAGWGLTVLGGQLTFFYATSFATPTTGWAVGAVQSGSIILRSDLSGFTWVAQSTPTTDALFGVSFPTIDVGTAVGANGRIVHTINGGTVWYIQSSGTTQTLNAVAFVNPRLGIAVGDAGTILRTTTGGVTAVGDNPESGMRIGLSVVGNPARAPETIRFALTLPVDAAATVRVLDVSGRIVATVASAWMPAGRRELAWTRTDARGVPVPAGVYFAEVESRNARAKTKFVVLSRSGL